MILIPETELNLRTACELVNTDRANSEEVTDYVALLTFMNEWSWTGGRDGDDAELNAVLDLRGRVGAIWDGAHDETQTVCRVNALLCDTNVGPWLTRHPEMPDWHLHLTSDGDPLVRRMGAGIAMAIADLIRAGELCRLKVCASRGCRAAVIDLSRNRCRMFCGTGNCGNRQHVAAYRERRTKRDE